MDYVESSKSTWAGRYSWGDENESSPGLNLNGTKLVTNLEQYMGSNTRVFSPFRGHRNALRLHALLQLGRHAARLPAQRRGRVRHPRLEGRRSGVLGHSHRSASPTTTESATAPTGRLRIRTARFSSSTTLRSRGANTRSASAARSAKISSTRWAISTGAAVSASPQPQRGIRSHHAAQGDAFASFLLGNVTLTEVAAQIASVQFRATSFAVYLDDVWKVTPKVTLSLGPALRKHSALGRHLGQPDHGLLTTPSTIRPNMTDQSRYPVFLRQGKSSGDPYAGLKSSLAQHPAGAGRASRQPPGESRQQRLRAAPGTRLEPEFEVGDPHRSRHVLQPGPGQSAFRCRPERRRTHAERRQSRFSRRNLAQRRGRPGRFGSQHPYAASLLQQVRSPHARIRCSGCSTCSANSPTT